MLKKFHVPKSPIIEITLVLILLAFAFWLTFVAGARGFYGLDQSLAFDGGYRIASGQIPYKDFVLGHGPLVFFITAFFFKLLGTNYAAYIFGAAIVNVLAVISSFFVVKQLFPRLRGLAYLAGCITAIWFYPPFGTPWADQTSFFFSLLGLQACLYGVLGNRPSSNRWMGLAGLLALLAVLSKQNAGAFFIPVYGILIVAAYLPQPKLILTKLLFFAGGFFLGTVLFCLWLWTYSNPQLFMEQYIILPLSAGRLTRGWLYLLKTVIWAGQFTLLPRLFIVLACTVSIYVVIVYLRHYAELKVTWKREFFAGILALYLTFFQFLFIYTLYNQEENAFPYIGIIFVIFIGLAHHLSSYLSFEKLPYKKFVKYMVAGLLAPCVFYLCLRGVEVALLRRVQDISPLFFSRGDAKLIELKDQNLKPLKWINPTMVSGVPISDVEFQELYTYLYREDKNFFIFPDFTAFYGLTQKPSPQPLLWFDRELTYDYRNCAYLDEWIVRDLKRHKVQIVVIEKISWLNTEERLNDFPKLKSFIFDNFIASQEIGIFQIFVSRRDRKN